MKKEKKLQKKDGVLRRRGKGRMYLRRGRIMKKTKKNLFIFRFMNLEKDQQ